MLRADRVSLVKAYAGISSRSTPEPILGLMKRIGYTLAIQGWTLRSGCAEGADSAFEDGAWDASISTRGAARPELFLPWPRFNGRGGSLVCLSEPAHWTKAIAREHHPNWACMGEGVQKLHMRNVHQVLGATETLGWGGKSRMVVCWTPGAEGGGGTGQALRIARAYDVPIFDLADPAVVDRITSQFWPSPDRFGLFTSKHSR